MNNKHRIFLGGTCNGSTWRDDLIPMLTEDYFNPVVEDWTPGRNRKCQAIEMEEKENKCDIHLYVITQEMTGVFSIAEAVDSAHRDDVITVFHVVRDGFTTAQLKSLDCVADLIMRRGAETTNYAATSINYGHFIERYAKNITTIAEENKMVETIFPSDGVMTEEEKRRNILFKEFVMRLKNKAEENEKEARLE